MLRVRYSYLNTHFVLCPAHAFMHSTACQYGIGNTDLFQSSVVRMRLLLLKSFFVFLASARQEHDIEMVRRSSSLNDHWQSNPPCWILRTGLCVARRPWNFPPEYLYSRWWCRCTHQHHQHIVCLENALSLIEIIYVNVFRFCITLVRTLCFCCCILLQDRDIDDQCSAKKTIKAFKDLDVTKSGHNAPI